MSAKSESRVERHAQRLRRVRRRRAVVAAIVLGIAGLTFADVRGRMEVGHIDAAQAVATMRLDRLHGDLGTGRVRIGTESGKLEFIEGTIAQRQSTIAVTNNQTAQHNAGIFLDDISFSALDGCLSGVTQALDQISVGETTGGLASLQAVGPVCQAAAP